MKAILLPFTLIIFFQLNVNASNDLVVKAQEHTDGYVMNKMTGDVDKANKHLLNAYKAIDEAVNDIEAAKHASTWYVHAMVYYYMGSNECSSFDACPKNALETAVVSFEKALTLGEPGINKVEMLCHLKQLAACLTNLGYKAYDKKNYAMAVQKLEYAIRAKDLLELNGWTAPGILNELTTIFYASYHSQDYDRTLFYGNQMIVEGMQDDSLLALMVDIYKIKGITYEKEEVIRLAMN